MCCTTRAWDMRWRSAWWLLWGEPWACTSGCSGFPSVGFDEEAGEPVGLVLGAAGGGLLPGASGRDLHVLAGDEARRSEFRLLPGRVRGSGLRPDLPLLQSDGAPDHHRQPGTVFSN